MNAGSVSEIEHRYDRGMPKGKIDPHRYPHAFEELLLLFYYLPKADKTCIFRLLPGHAESPFKDEDEPLKDTIISLTGCSMKFFKCNLYLLLRRKRHEKASHL